MSDLIGVPAYVVRMLVARTLAEDFGRSGDLTTESVVPADATGRWVIAAREAGIVAGIDCAAFTFFALDRDLRFRVAIGDGKAVTAGDVIATVEGRARPVLTGERTALNFLGHLSGIATLTARYVALVEGTGAKICCTRKTTPGLRTLEKYAVRAGGGSNHRHGLDDAVLIKDNHIALAGGVAAAVAAARASVGHMVKIEVEVDTIDQLRAALDAGAEIVLLDNMTLDELTEAVAITAGRAVLEASGGVDETTVAAVAATGVDLISVGRLTHSAPTLDVGLDTVGERRHRLN